MKIKREDYLEIKDRFAKFVDAWKTGNNEALNQIFIPEAACNLSTVEKYPCGSQHGIFGISDFVRDRPEPDFFFITPCNFVARFNEENAYQTATLVCKVGVIEGENVRIIEFSALISNVWIKTESSWRISEFKMDIVECSGDYTEFIDKWYFEKPDLKYYFGIHLPVISGELDNPWNKAPIEIDGIKTEEECILETFTKYAFGIDTLVFTNLITALSDDLVVNMAPWGAMDKREFMQTLKYKRQAGRYWNHPVKLDCVEINGSEAELRLHRMAGHKQSDHPVIITKENYDTNYACARYEIKMKKEQGKWRILRMDYFLGTIDLGKFEA